MESGPIRLTLLSVGLVAIATLAGCHRTQAGKDAPATNKRGASGTGRSTDGYTCVRSGNSLIRPLPATVAKCCRCNRRFRRISNGCPERRAGVNFNATGYVQNPTGASISEAAQPLLALLNSDGSLAQNLGFTGGARHNQLSTVASLDGRWLLGGMVNGPGTHSGDVQRQLIVADGFLRERSDLPTE